MLRCFSASLKCSFCECHDHKVSGSIYIMLGLVIYFFRTLSLLRECVTSDILNCKKQKTTAKHENNGDFKRPVWICLIYILSSRSPNRRARMNTVFGSGNTSIKGATTSTCNSFGVCGAHLIVIFHMFLIVMLCITSYISRLYTNVCVTYDKRRHFSS